MLAQMMWGFPTKSAAGGDPNFANVSLLLHGEGSNGSTDITDSSSFANVITASGNAAISTAQSKFGGSSIYFDGSGDFVTSPTSANLNIFTSGDFTLECWVYANSFTTSPYIVSTTRGASPWYGRCALQITSSGTINFYTVGDSGSGAVVSSTSSAISTGAWNHIAVSRSGSTTRIFVNGVVGFTGAIGTTSTLSQRLELGAAAFNNSNYFSGYIDDLRITKGVARYTANFTPPTAAFPDN